MDRSYLLIAAICLLACASGEKRVEDRVVPGGPPPGDATTSWLDRYDLSTKDPQQFRLEKKLSEASGLAMTDDGRLFCHDDESAVVYQVEYTTGKILKSFTFGSGFLEDDFEGIAIRKDTFYVVNSSGNLFAFPEAADRGRTPFRLIKTSLSQKNDVEGLEYDPETDCLLLACKGDPGKELGDYKAVYAFSLETQTLFEKPRLLIPVKELKHARGNFNPSGIARHPEAGTFFVISADGGSIIEITSEGHILGHRDLPKKANSQPEGIAFAPDLSLIICNDGQGDAGYLTVYPVAR